MNILRTSGIDLVLGLDAKFKAIQTVICTSVMQAVTAKTTFRPESPAYATGREIGRQNPTALTTR